METTMVDTAAMVFAVFGLLRKARMSPRVYLPMFRQGSAITSNTVM